VHAVNVTGVRGYDSVIGNVRTGMNSGYQALHVAMQTGASKILLLGVDFTLRHGIHWHGAHVTGLGNPSERLFDRCRNMFTELATVAQSLGTEVVNCSDLSTVTAFRKSSLEVELDRNHPSP